jgi:hypothetical protein
MSDSSEPTNPPYPQQRTPEQHDAVRRRALPLAFCGLICGIAGIALLAMRDVGAEHPPNVIAVNLSFCALLMGAGLIFYAKGTPGTGAAVLVAVAALLTGLAGPALYARQTLFWRAGTEGRELENVAAIARAAKAYAAENGGVYPPDLMVLLEQQRITPKTLISPFGATEILKDDVKALRARFKDEDVRSTIDAHSDYIYVGSDLRLPPATQPGAQAEGFPPEIVVAYAKSPVMRSNQAVAFADGRGRFATLEQAQQIWQAGNKARAKLGLPALAHPASVERALRKPGEP